VEKGDVFAVAVAAVAVAVAVAADVVDVSISIGFGLIAAIVSTIVVSSDENSVSVGAISSIGSLGIVVEKRCRREGRIWQYRYAIVARVFVECSDMAAVGRQSLLRGDQQDVAFHRTLRLYMEGRVLVDTSDDLVIAFMQVPVFGFIAHRTMLIVMMILWIHTANTSNGNELKTEATELIQIQVPLLTVTRFHCVD
jgi:hypothetical protein